MFWGLLVSAIFIGVVVVDGGDEGDKLGVPFVVHAACAGRY
jgi:hypothetical protein